MRIVSQDGRIDLPYENCIISINMQKQGEIIAWTGNHISDDECVVMAVYSSFVKTQKAMEMLHEEYRQYTTAKSGVYWFDFDYPKVFQFPQDEDVEA